MLKDHKSAEAITQQGYEIAATEGTGFWCKPAQLVITKFIDCENKKELLSGLPHVGNINFHLRLIDLDLNRGITILFILPLTGKVWINKNIFFQISINKSEANQLFPVLRFFVL